MKKHFATQPLTPSYTPQPLYQICEAEFEDASQLNLQIQICLYDG